MNKYDNVSRRYKICKRLVFILLTILIASSNADQTYHVKDVIDGDTIMLSNRRLVRYIGIDCPEMNYHNGKPEAFASKAKELNKNLLSGRFIHILFDLQEKDHFGRMLAYVYTNDGLFVNDKMLKSGYAWVLYKRPNIKYHKILLTSQRYAMLKKIGMWKYLEEKDGMKYLGNIKSKRFHKAECQFGKQTASKNRIIFQKNWDAFYAGFSPCKKCM